VHKYERINEALRYLILDNAGNIWDSTQGFGTPLLTIGGMTDFACVSLFNRAYISPSTGAVGTTGEKVYVYEASGTARAAAGTGVTSGGAMVGADQALGTKVEKGHHLFAIACETDSGFITTMGLTAATGLLDYDSADGGKGIDLTNIPVGPAGTVKRHLVATQVLPTDYNGNPAEQAWYFVPTSKFYEPGTSTPAPSRLEDNVTTDVHVDFFDADLLVSADYLQYQKTEIPAGCHLTHFEGRLVVSGQPTNDNVVLVSESGKPESISDLNGYIIIDPGDMGGGVKNAVEHRGLLYLTKTARTYVTSDNGSSPATWNTNLVDANMGCEPLGVAELLDLRGATQDLFLVANRNGLYTFVGSYSEERNLAWKIQDLWDRINTLYFHLVHLHVDPISRVIYVAVPLDAATAPSHILVGDYKQGLDLKAIRWSLWVTPKVPTQIWTETDYTTQLGKLKYGSSANTIYEYTAASRRDHDGANLINAYARFGQFSFNNEGAVNHYTGLRMRVRGYGQLDVDLYGLDDASTQTPAALILSAASGKEMYEHVNFESEEMSVKVGTNSMWVSNPSYFTLTHLRIAGKPRWSNRPTN
jgi:hypothetical protein